MKRLLIDLTDEEYERLLRVKGDRTWKELLLSLAPKSKEELLIEKVNNCFMELEELDLENMEFYEVIRVILTRFIRKDLETASKMLKRLAELLGGVEHGEGSH